MRINMTAKLLALMLIISFLYPIDLYAAVVQKVLKVQITVPVTMVFNSVTKANVKVTMSPANAKLPKVIYKSDNPKVATIDSSGKIKAVGVGTATLFATANSVTDKSVITVRPDVLMLNAFLDSKFIMTYEMKSIQTAISTLPTTARPYITYKVLNEQIAKVDAVGTIIGLKSVGDGSFRFYISANNRPQRL